VLTESERHRLQAACDRLIDTQKTLLLATRSPASRADISYAPYLRDDASFYIFVSELAEHTENMLAYSQASILFIEPESECSELFARQRLSFDCLAREVLRADPVYESILDAMTERLGKTMTLLRQLPDFHLIALTPTTGRFVAGFGKACQVDAMGRIQWNGD